MDKKSKVLLWVFALLIIASVGVTYWRIMIKKDYVIEAQVDCDPYEKNCFVWECDPESDVEGEACTGDPESDIWYFNVARRNAGNIPLCDPETDENCDPWTCVEPYGDGVSVWGEKDCETVYCNEENMEEQYATACVEPVQFAIDNPIEEEAIECDPSAAEAGEDDEECLALQESEEIICEEGDEECLVAEEEACDPEVDDCTVDEEILDESADAPIEE